MMAPHAEEPPALRSPFIPTFLLAIALVIWLAFQGSQLWRERAQLNDAHAGLQSQVDAATKLRASLDAVATATAKLAAGGNEGARVIVEELRKRGVTIAPASAAKPP